jgi:hypothetical protein
MASIHRAALLVGMRCAQQASKRFCIVLCLSGCTFTTYGSVHSLDDVRGSLVTHTIPFVLPPPPPPLPTSTPRCTDAAERKEVPQAQGTLPLLLLLLLLLLPPLRPRPLLEISCCGWGCCAQGDATCCQAHESSREREREGEPRTPLWCHRSCSHPPIIPPTLFFAVSLRRGTCPTVVAVSASTGSTRVVAVTQVVSTTTASTSTNSKLSLLFRPLVFLPARLMSPRPRLGVD